MSSFTGGGGKQARKKEWAGEGSMVNVQRKEPSSQRKEDQDPKWQEGRQASGGQ